MAPDGSGVLHRTAAPTPPGTNGRFGLSPLPVPVDWECSALQRNLNDGHTRLSSGETAAPLEALLASHRERQPYGFQTAIVVFVKDRRGILLDVSTVVTQQAENIVHVHSETLTPGGEAAFGYTVHVQNVQQLEQLIHAVSQVDSVVTVVRGVMEDLLRNSPSGFWANCNLRRPGM